MKQLEEIRSILLEKETLTAAQAHQIKGGGTNDEKRRSRPGGGVGTHRPSGRD